MRASAAKRKLLNRCTRLLSKSCFLLSVRVGHLRCERHTLYAESSLQRWATHLPTSDPGPATPSSTGCDTHAAATLVVSVSAQTFATSTTKTKIGFQWSSYSLRKSFTLNDEQDYVAEDPQFVLPTGSGIYVFQRILRKLGLRPFLRKKNVFLGWLISLLNSEARRLNIRNCFLLSYVGV